MTSIHPVFASFANKAAKPTTTTQPQQTQSNEVKIEKNGVNKNSQTATQNAELKALLQNPEDPLAKYPLRGFGYANEIGAAVSAMPGWGKSAEALLWVPALMYLGADIFDKYSRGKEGNYSNASVHKAVEQATFQGLASVLLPTAAVKMGQKLAGLATKYDGSKLTANSQEEIFRKLSDDFDKAKFAKSDYITEAGEARKGIDRVLDKVLNADFDEHLTNTKLKVEKEKLWAKTCRFFGHSSDPVSSSKADRNIVNTFVRKKTEEIFELQSKIENISNDDVSSLDNSIQKLYKKALKKIDTNVEKLFSENPSYVLKKILNTNDTKYAKYQNELLEKYPTREQLKLFLRDKKATAEWIKKAMENPNDKTVLSAFAKKIEISRNVIGKFIKGKEMRMGWLKTAGGFIALACLAVPIDHFVHKYIIKHAVAPALENVEKFNQSFKKREQSK